jgi:endo-1,4-beta-mannosidase
MTFRLGLNYWPVSSAMYWWRHFDATEVAQDFARIRAAGFDTVRFFLRWEDFQPTPGRVEAAMLTHLVTVADIAAHHALALMPTLFTGHMSGVNWIPPWALTPESGGRSALGARRGSPRV